MDQTNELGLPLFLILCGVLGMLLLALAIIVFFMVYQKRLFAQHEAMQKMEVENQKKLLQYSIEAQEAERKRIASDLHDDIGSVLSATRIYVHQLNPELSLNDYQELKTDTVSLIDNAINTIRGISHNLFPPNLEHLGLLQVTNDFCHRIQKMNNMGIQFEYNQEPQLTQHEELVLYRILQELTTNTLKYAQATKIEVVFNSNASSFKMTYKDNGVGFNFEASHSLVKGLGLKNIESRANSIGATIHMKSQKDQGVYFELFLSTA